MRELIGIYKGAGGVIGGFAYDNNLGILYADEDDEVYFVDLVSPFVPVWLDYEDQKVKDVITFLSNDNTGVAGVLFTKDGYILIEDLTFFEGSHRNTTTGEVTVWENSGMSEVLDDCDMAEGIIEAYSGVFFL